VTAKKVKEGLKEPGRDHETIWRNANTYD